MSKICGGYDGPMKPISVEELFRGLPVNSLRFVQVGELATANRKPTDAAQFLSIPPEPADAKTARDS